MDQLIDRMRGTACVPLRDGVAVYYRRTPIVMFYNDGRIVVRGRPQRDAETRDRLYKIVFRPLGMRLVKARDGELYIEPIHATEAHVPGSMPFVSGMMLRPGRVGNGYEVEYDAVVAEEGSGNAGIS